MRFDRLLWECLLPGEFEVSDEKKSLTVALDPLPGETVLTFAIDCEAFRDRQARIRVCDVLFFYRKARTCPVLLFVELKGNAQAHEDAEKQILGAVEHVVGRLDRACLGADSDEAAKDLKLLKAEKKVALRAVVVFGDASPVDLKPYQQQLHKRTGLHVRHVYEQRRKRTSVREFVA